VAAGQAEVALGDVAGGVPGHHTRLTYKDSNGKSEILQITNFKKNHIDTKLNFANIMSRISTAFVTLLTPSRSGKK